MQAKLRGDSPNRFNMLFSIIDKLFLLSKYKLLFQLFCSHDYVALVT